MPDSERVGSQLPTFTTAPPLEDLGDAGAVALQLFESYGVDFYESQKYEVRLYMARDEAGDFAAKSIYISKPRQNGKSFSARFYCIYCAAVLGMRVLYTAHRARTARKMFKAIADFVQGSTDWRRALKYPQGIYKAPGYEGVYFTSPHGGPGGSIEFMTRGAGVRGDTADVIVIDEAQELTAEQEEALLPASIAGSEVTRKLSQQVLYIGTPPDEKTRGTVFQDAHDKAHAGVLYGSWWLEWAADAPLDPEATQAEALAVMYATNPAMGYRIREETMLERWAKMTPEGFAREHLGWWADYRTAGVLIDARTWEAAATTATAPNGVRCLGVKFEPAGLRASLCVAVRPEAGGPYRIEQVGQYDTTHGLEALISDVLKMAPKAAEICADGGGYAQTLCERLIARGVPSAKVHRPSSLEVSAAASNLLSMLKEGSVQHWAGEGQRMLDESATMTAKRSVGRSGGFSFASTEEAYAEPIEAAALALLWALKTRKDPNRKARIF